ncbi:hypothetical protein TSUD_149980 [Trifolium subterraneum]|uniref:Uncharacterized protein n=1 Tax=Trifolium subterraneum TaxID=3900 RepID=A0A2Z6MCA9_TRISU|nr:hypothetical protein TSUD_149980 [Trifolium subterraneum]
MKVKNGLRMWRMRKMKEMTSHLMLDKMLVSVMFLVMIWNFLPLMKKMMMPLKWKRMKMKMC